eukprot:854133-Pleurochrysis_carterae.AAC.1
MRAWGRRTQSESALPGRFEQRRRARTRRSRIVSAEKRLNASVFKLSGRLNGRRLGMLIKAVGASTSSLAEGDTKIDDQREERNGAMGVERVEGCKLKSAGMHEGRKKELDHALSCASSVQRSKLVRRVRVASEAQCLCS